jgi:plasmid stability protein
MSKLDELKQAIADGFAGSDKRAYIDREGTHYFRLVEYDFYDGKFDPETNRGYSGTVGPLFLWESLGGIYPAGDRRGRVVSMLRTGKSPAATGKARSAATAEVRDIVRALLSSEDPADAEALDADTLFDLISNVDLMSSSFIGAIVRCDVSARVADGKTYHNCRWSADDRESR